MKAALVLVFGMWFVLAQEIENERQYRDRMQEIDHTFAVLQENRNVRQGADVENEARTLSELFEKVEAFWKGRGNEEAAGFAAMARKGADGAADAARKKEQKSLDAAIATIASSCEGCHKEPLDKYRFK